MSKKDTGKIKKNSSTSISPEEIIDSFKRIASTPSAENSLESVTRATGISSSLILESESPYRLKKLTALIIERLGALIPGLEHESFSASDLGNEKGISSFLFSCEADSLFSKAKVIVVRDADILKVAQIGRLLPLLPLRSKTMIIFHCKKVPTAENWKKLLTASSLCTLKEFSVNDLNKWLQQEAKRRGAAGISSEGRNYLVHEVACSIEMFDHILEKACLLTEIGEEISLATLQSLSEASLQKDSFDLFAAISKQDTLAAQLILHSMLQGGTHPLQILGFFNKAIKSIVINKSTAEKHDPIYFAELHNAWFTKKLNPERFPEKRLKKAIQILAELDSDMKGKNFGENICLQSKLMSI